MIRVAKPRHPPGWRMLPAIAAGTTHSLALLADGSVVGWGSDSYGKSTPPDGLSDVVAIAAGQYYSLALRADGTVVAWGVYIWGQPTSVSETSLLKGGIDCS
ncbi:MAG: hypothetical protein EA425_11790 [Puniceicoccaceae bacterium]|nr:MAG: hypothetical protein EA425_11790 [Puniceicoccaceae bacterium]